VADLTQRYGRGLHLSFNYDPRLIGGLRVKVGSDIFDGTVRGRLAALEDRVSRG
jgi:F-type H+-transporting ATPase subunit delta